MDWSKTKSIFIMVFFILNIFLLYQYLEKRDNSQYELITEASIDEMLKGDQITYEPLPKPTAKEQFLIAQSKVFTKDDIKELPNQKIKMNDSTRLVGIFDKPLSISQTIQSAELEQLLKDYIWNGSDYQYWSYDEQNGTIVFYQHWDEKMFFNNSKGKVTLYLNKNQQVISYEQTYLEKIEKFKKPKELVSAIKAIETLYINGNIPPKSHITKVELGYYNSLQTTSATHLLAPTWRVVVNDELDLFVNAFDKSVIELNTEEKILE